MFTAIHKHYSLEEWKLFAANHPECLEVHFSTVNYYGLLLCSELTASWEWVVTGVSWEYCCQVRFWGMKIFAVLKFIKGSGLSWSKRTAMWITKVLVLRCKKAKFIYAWNGNRGVSWTQKEEILGSRYECCASVAVGSCGSASKWIISSHPTTGWPCTLLWQGKSFPSVCKWIWSLQAGGAQVLGPGREEHWKLSELVCPPLTFLHQSSLSAVSGCAILLVLRVLA